MSFFITAGSGYKSGSSYSNTNVSGLNQMTNAVSPGNSFKNTRFKGGANSSGKAAPQPTLRTFKVDPFDYEPRRVGLRHAYKAIVIDYSLKSTGKRYLHNIKAGRYSDPMAFGISVSRSGSFADALKAEISRIVDRIYADHCEYLPPERIERH